MTRGARGVARQAAAALLAASLAGCATTAPDEQTLSRVGDTSPGGRAIERVPLGSWPLGAELRRGRTVRVEVRLADRADLDESWPGGLESGAVRSGGAAAMTAYLVVSAPLAGPAIVGAAALTPAYLIIGIDQEIDGNALEDALHDHPLVEGLQRDLDARLASGADSGAEDLVVEVVVPAYGFVSLYEGGELWFHADAALRVTDRGREVFADRIYWRAHKRSEGVPAPRHADLSEWADDDARRARAALTEASQVLSRLVARALEVDG